MDKIEEAREMLRKLDPTTEEQMMMKKIRMVLIRQFLEDTRRQIKGTRKII